jgi:putative ABC transport system permease protein
VSGALHLAWRYLAYHRVKTAILVASVALIGFLPAGLNVLVGESAAELTARADATPVVLGAKGSPLELVLSSLYFGADTPPAIPWAELERVAGSGLADPIPLHLRFRVGEHPIVGTSLEYFDFRRLRLASGRRMAVLGECVVGAEVAARLGVGPGDTLVSSPESVFDLAGAYPLKLHVTGVLEPSYGPDDEAVFVDVKTTWVMAGLGHGHQDLVRPEAASAVLSREGTRVTGNASVVEYNEITPENIDSFHFHGDRSGHPLTALIPVPRDERSRVILMGRYQGAEEDVQIVRPREVMDELLATILTIRSFVIAAVGLVALGTLATAALVFALSVRLRRREIETLHKIGASRGTVTTLLVSEVVGVLLLAGMLAAALTWATSRFGSGAIRSLLLSG